MRGSKGSGGGLVRGNPAALPARGAAAECDDDLTIAELRQLAENPNFNLTSVLQNPREASARTLYAELLDFDPFQFAHDLFKDDFEHDLSPGAKLPPPPVPLPHVTADMFSSYLAKHGALADRFMANHRHTMGPGGGGGTPGEASSGTTRHTPVAQHSAAKGAGAASTAAGGLAAARVGAAKGGRVAPPSPAQVYAEVPALFQKAHFTLAEPAVFEQVVLLAPEDRQAQLSHYLDLVELCLLHQISSRQEAFFEALSNLQALRTDVADACGSVSALRQGIGDLQQHMVSEVMRVPQLARRKQNLGALSQQLELMVALVERYDAVQGLFEAADFVTALSLIKRCQRTIRRDLPGLKCLGPVAKQLGEYEVSAARFLATQFVSVSINEDDAAGGVGSDSDGSDGSDDEDGGSGGAGAAGPGAAATPGGGSGALALPKRQRVRVAQLVRSLVRLGEMTGALAKHRRRLEDSVKLIVRIAVEEYVYDKGGQPPDGHHGDGAGAGGGGGSGGGGGGAAAPNAVDAKLGQRLAGLESGAFLACLGSAFESMLDALRRAAMVHAVVAETLAEPERALKADQAAAAAAAAASAAASGPVGDGTSNGGSAGNGSTGAKAPGSGGGGDEGEEEDDDNLADAPLRWADFPARGGASNEGAGGGDHAGHAAGAGGPAGGAGAAGGGAGAAGGGGASGADMVAESLAGLRGGCELAQKTAAALLANRKEVHAKLPAGELRDLQACCFDFLQQVERLSGRSCYGLRSSLLAQAKAFLEHRQEANKTSLAAALDSEKWTQADVSSERQAAIDRLASGQAFMVQTAGAGGGAAAGGGGVGGGGVVAARKGPKSADVAAVEGSRFKVVWSCLLLVEMVGSLLETAAHFPLLATDVLTRVVELLQLFNSRATQLVLLAGAIHSSARLPKITAKHLALTSQCLCLVMALLPHVRAALAAQLPPRQHLLLVEMDRAKQDLVEHHERILSKFVSIVGEIVDSLSKSVAATDWDRSQGASSTERADSSGSSAFVGDTIKNVSTMHRVLSAQLPPEQVQEIFTRIFELLNRKVPEYFASVEPATPAGQQRVLDDVQFLAHALERLRGVSAANLSLEGHFRKRFPNAR